MYDLGKIYLVGIQFPAHVINSQSLLEIRLLDFHMPADSRVDSPVIDRDFRRGRWNEIILIGESFPLAAQKRHGHDVAQRDQDFIGEQEG